MSQTLYRAYRPHVFSDVIGQKNIVQTLQNAITSDRIGHAYLFTGPRGTGKTTVARLFAVAINTTKRKGFTPVSDDIAQRLNNGVSMDVIEIDAASSTSVEGIRTLKETVAVAPSEAAFKVYIIDEVHMLSTSAFNALLKTLEEPPAHVIFILATTEIHKVPETIISRCQRFDFARFTVDEIKKKLTAIALQEKVSISDEAVEMIAITANGGMRDAESLLAQVFALEDKKITADEVAKILGTTTRKEIFDFLDAIVDHDTTRALTIIRSVMENGYNIDTYIRSLIEKLRIILFFSLSDTVDPAIESLIIVPKDEKKALATLAQKTHASAVVTMIEECTQALQKTKRATIQQLPLEIAVITLCGISTHNDKNMSSDTSSASSQPLQKADNTISSPHKERSHTSTVHKSSDTSHDTFEHQWKDCLTHIDTEHKTLASLLAQCTACMTPDHCVTITTTRPFYKEKITEPRNRAIIDHILCSVIGHTCKISVTVDTAHDATSSEIIAYAQQLMGSSAVAK